MVKKAPTVRHTTPYLLGWCLLIFSILGFFDINAYSFNELEHNAELIVYTVIASLALYTILSTTALHFAISCALTSALFILLAIYYYNYYGYDIIIFLLSGLAIKYIDVAGEQGKKVYFDILLKKEDK